MGSYIRDGWDGWDGYGGTGQCYERDGVASCWRVVSHEGLQHSSTRLRDLEIQPYGRIYL